MNTKVQVVRGRGNQSVVWKRITSKSCCVRSSTLTRCGETSLTARRSNLVGTSTTQQRGYAGRCKAQQGEGPTLTPELRAAVDRLIEENKIVLFMKGTKMFPQCGFSNTCVQILNQLGAPFEDVNVLEDERIRLGMKEYSQWPTFPQVYIEGDFYGGCDILLESYQSGELQEYIERVLAS